eukprot:181251-Hanusia_phi.AAC.1
MQYEDPTIRLDVGGEGEKFQRAGKVHFRRLFRSLLLFLFIRRTCYNGAAPLPQHLALVPYLRNVRAYSTLFCNHLKLLKTCSAPPLKLVFLVDRLHRGHITVESEPVKLHVKMLSDGSHHRSLILLVGHTHVKLDQSDLPDV